MENKINWQKYNRIIILGSPGSGKSWLSKQLAQKTGLPLIHLDKEYWNPGWEETPKDKWAEKIQELIKKEKWIIDGNYNTTVEMRFTAADLVLFLDVSRWLCVWRAAKRTGKKRSDLPGFLEEPSLFDKEFLEFCRFIWAFPKTGKITILDMHQKYPDKTFIRIKNKRQIRTIVKSF